MPLFSYLLHPIAQYLALAVAFSLCIATVLNLKSQNRGLCRRVEELAEEARSADKRLGELIEQLERQLREAEEQYRLSAGAPVKSLMNINKRTQAVRMIRAGDASQHIASTLGMPKGEVDLLVKVHGIIMNSYALGSDSTGGNETDSKIRASA